MKKHLPVLLIAILLLAIAAYQTLETQQTTSVKTSSNKPRPTLGLMKDQNPDNNSQVFAIKQLQDYLQGQPDDADHWIQLGNLLFDNGNFADAVKPYTEALRLQPENPDVRTDLGVCLFNTGMNDEAILQFERALQYAPDHITATFNLGIVHTRMGHTPSAVQYWRKTIRLGPDTDMGKKATRALTDAGYKP